MKICQKISGFVLCGLALTACNSSKKGAQISVKVDGLSNGTVYLEQLGLYETKLVDSAKSDEKGNITFNEDLEPDNFYRIKIGNKAVYFVSDNNDIKISTNIHNVDSYTTEGSVASNSLNTFINSWKDQDKKITLLGMTLDSLQSRNAPDSVIKAVQNDIAVQSNQSLAFIKNFADTVSSLPVAIFAVGNLDINKNKDFFTKFSTDLSHKFPNKKLTDEFVMQIKNALSNEKSVANRPAVGTLAPDFTLNSINGQKIQLSSLRGKYVLLDFWASWCTPCMSEMPEIVNTFNENKNKNFTILGVSLDKDAHAWKAAVDQHKMAWPQVSELAGWKSTVASIYGIEMIPSNYLISPTGYIVATDLHGEGLAKVLSEKLK